MTQVCVYTNFDALPAAYRALFDASCQRDGFFLSWPWFHNLSRKGMEASLNLRIYGVESSELQSHIQSETPQLKAHLALPMCFSASSHNPLQPNTLRAVATYYSSLFGPVFTELNTEQHLHTLITFIAGELPRWDIVDMHPLPNDTAWFLTMQQAFRQAGMAVDSYYCFGNWYLQVRQRTYQQYFDALPSKLKNTVLRKTRFLQNAGRLHLKIAATIPDVEIVTAAYMNVYKNSWKHPEPFPDFIPGWLAESAAQGWLRLGLAYVDGKPVAAQIWLVQQGKASIYKLAYDQQFAHYSIGSILTAHMMQHVIDVDRVDEVDYLTGDEIYKQDWMSDRRERWGIIAFNRASVKGRLAYYYHLARRYAKRFHK
ncbi:GNAT family N-acetyltransferase [Solimicrobium silvestre]|uniref:Acetyltransferase (GNAT) domain n=1 Tax=Solimicrobium silvestre TaxID=2099400 RepID=A0A2S9H0L0_9BURK|nr:GNAT family N-acetyltransferase [Solimicrobium silvestre]PRC93524.1 Acetyltransferase (GNAT) domain [Solimicrobium silvestre]